MALFRIVALSTALLALAASMPVFEVPMLKTDANHQPASVLGLTSEQYDALDDIPGSDFIQKGFDVTNDSVSEYVSKGGETSLLPVYKFTYDQQMTYKNPYTQVIYKVADQMSPTTNTQAMEFIVQDISYSFSEVLTYFEQRFNIGISINIKNIGLSVKYNQEMATAKDTVSNKSHVFFGSQKWWKIYDIAAYPPLLVGSIDPMFTMALSHLPKTISTDADRAKYHQMVQAWGTHYAVHANFGGKLIHNVYVDTSYYYSKTQSWISTQISLNFHFDAFAIDAGGFQNRSQIKIDQTFQEHSKSYLFYEGGLPALQTNQTLAQWEPTIAQAPHFLNATLNKISELAADPAIRQTLGGYIDEYIKNGGRVSGGPSPPPKPPPKPSPNPPPTPSKRRRRRRL